MNDGVLFVAVFGICFIAILAIIFLFVRKNCCNSSSRKYDERQRQAQGIAYQSALLSGVFYMIICAALWELKIYWAELSAQMLFGVFLVAAVFVDICIFKDAYFSPFGTTGKKMVLWFVFVLFMGVTNCWLAIGRMLSEEGLIKEGILTIDDAINLGVGTFFIVVSIAMLIKMIINRIIVEEE